MKENPVCWQIELSEDDDENEGCLVISACGGQVNWWLTEEEEIKLAKHLYNKHFKSGVAWV